MRKRIINILKCKRGSSYVDMVLLVLVSIMAIVLALNVFSYLVLKQDLDYIATKTADAAALNGIAGNTGEEYDEVESIFEAACRAEGREVGTGANEISFQLDVPENGEYYESTKKVQLGDPIRVTVLCRTEFRGLGLLSKLVEIDCKSVKISLSRVYWKE